MNLTQAGLGRRKEMATSFESPGRKIKYCRISKSSSERFVKIKQTVITHQRDVYKREKEGK